MIMQRARLCLTAVLIRGSCLLPAVAVAQSLTLDYELNLNAQRPANVSVTNNPCDVGRLSLLLRCRGEVADQFVWNIRDHSVSSNPSPASVGDYAAAVNREPRSLLFADDVLSPSTPGEVTLRLGTKYRLRYNADIEPYRFFDARYEAWAQRNELNSIGVELLFPFH